MKRTFSSKDKRKQAEDKIIRDMIKIRQKLDEKKQDNEAEDQKARVMSVLTRFVKLKKDTKIH